MMLRKKYRLMLGKKYGAISNTKRKHKWTIGVFRKQVSIQEILAKEKLMLLPWCFLKIACIDTFFTTIFI
jgi:hypothetical protein